MEYVYSIIRSYHLVDYDIFLFRFKLHFVTGSGVPFRRVCKESLSIIESIGLSIFRRC